jgi:cell division protease FtsH
VSAEIDAEVKKIISDAHKRAKDIIVKHKEVLRAIAKRLVETETIEREEFEKLLVLHGIEPKRKKDIEHQPLV